MTPSHTAAVVFDGPRLTMARRLAGLRKSDLAALTGMSAAAVAAWESGAKRPTAATVARLALSLQVDPGFFAVGPYDLAAHPVTPHFRSPRSTSQLARDQALAYGQLAADIAASLERHVECPAAEVPAVAVDVAEQGGGGPERAARAVREAWAMPRGPARHLIRLLESHGVLVVFSPPRAARVDAYSFDSRPRPVVVLSSLRRDYYRQRLDVAHELGHLVMHSGSEPGGRLVEQQADRFAAELLMPAALIRQELPASMGSGAWHALARLKEQWGVPIAALLQRARSVGRLSEVSYRNAMSTLTTRGWRHAEPGRVTMPEHPSMLPGAVEVLSASGAGADALIGQCRAPADLFRAVTSRVPFGVEIAVAGGPGHGDHARQGGARVASLLDWD
jgi:Zn-dependent peptidase ImmA (M78 family)/transcriptional regulator with XRE-family HTH domain